MENEETITQAQYKKLLVVNAMKITADIFFIALLIYGLINASIHLNDYIVLGKDVCRLCENKTGASCAIIKPTYINKSFSASVNLSEFVSPIK